MDRFDLFSRTPTGLCQRSAPTAAAVKNRVTAMMDQVLAATERRFDAASSERSMAVLKAGPLRRLLYSLR